MKSFSDEQIIHIQVLLKKKYRLKNEEKEIDFFFKRIYNFYGESMTRIISPILYFNQDVVSDVFQEAWIDVFQSFHRFEVGKSLKTWISVIFYRKAKKTLVRIAKNKISKDENDIFFDHEISTESNYEKQIDLENLYKALDRLSEKEYLLIDLFYFQNKNVITVCEELNISRGSFYYRLKRVQKKIKNFLEDFERNKHD